MISIATDRFPEEFKFVGRWRIYQQRVLNDVEKLLDDNCLNIVAAPGAGKTTLGIETIRLLGKPALIISPTITIKEQWKERIINGFLPNGYHCDWISDDLKDIKIITTTTYQALHSVFKSEYKKEFLKKLKEQKVNTIVLDEAHHLRTEWWKSLTELVESLEMKEAGKESGFDKSKLSIVSLTATPPYDVSQQEWNNYCRLCGPIDAEISVPELVKSGDLCPHQDLIYFSNLNSEEAKIVYDYNENRSKFFEILKKESDFAYIIESSPWVEKLDNSFELIFDSPEFTASIASYLLWLDEMHMGGRLLVEFMGIKPEQLPEFNYKTAEMLINGVLGKYKDHFKNLGKIREILRNLKLMGDSNSVNLTGNKSTKGLLARSINKLNSIKDIVNIEYGILKDKLRLVVLLDYIGKDTKVFGLNILSVFKTIKEQNIEGIKLGILTGSSVIIPSTAKEALLDICTRRRMTKEEALLAEYDENHFRVEFYGNDNHNIVSIITEIFSRGEINVLIGTQALLGEGWDSPAVNTLILASTVGSFMLSNQMRGRAIRMCQFDKEKTSNIWHLASLENFDGAENLDNNDFEIIIRRFNTFEGLVYDSASIESGIKRLGLKDEQLNSLSVDKLNDIMIKRAKKRQLLAAHWQEALEGNEKYGYKNKAQRVYEGIKTKDFKVPCQYLKTKILKHLLYEVGSGSLLTLSIFTFSNSIMLALILGFFSLSQIIKDFPSFIKDCWLYLKHGSTEGSLNFVGNCIVETLHHISAIKTEPSQIVISTKKFEDNSAYVTIDNCSDYDRAIFSKCVLEWLSPVENPRYIVMRKGRGFQVDYFAIPDIIAAKKEYVEFFCKKLEEIYGYIDIIYTKNPEGRKALLNARFNSSSSAFKKNTEKIKVWM